MSRPIFEARSPIEDYKKWVKLTAEYYLVTPEEILNTKKYREPYLSNVRYTFYRLCMFAGIHMGQLSIHLGKCRVCIMSSLSKYKHKINRDAERTITNRFNTSYKDDIRTKT